MGGLRRGGGGGGGLSKCIFLKGSKSKIKKNTGWGDGGNFSDFPNNVKKKSVFFSWGGGLE